METLLVMQNFSESKQLEETFQSFDDLLFVLDDNGTILDFKTGDPTRLSLSSGNFLGQKMTDLLPGETGNKLMDAMKSAFAGNRVAVVEYFLPSSTGDYWYETRLVPVNDQQIFMFVRNITKQKLTESKINRQLERLEALRSIDLAITSGLDLKLTLSYILDHVRQQLNVDAASILLLSPHSQVLEFAAGSGFGTPALQHTRLRIGEGYAGQAVLDRKTIHVSNLQSRQTDFLRSPFFSRENFSSYYAIPLTSKGVSLGVMEIFHRAPLSPDQDWLNFMDMLAGQAAIAIDSAMMFKDLQTSNVELRLAYDKTIEGWSHALNLRDRETEEHTQRVVELTLELAQEVKVPFSSLIHIRRGAILHDIGKVSISDNILLKPGPLSHDEWIVMRRHPLIAVELLSPITYLAPTLDIPRSHHERWDGAGYPDGLAGEQIPLAARIFALVDVYDALTSDRPYRKAWTKKDALDYIRSETGKHFDPNIAPLFLDMIRDMDNYL